MGKSELKDMTIMQALLDAGVKKNDMFSHQSDLYVPVTELTTCVIEDWQNATGKKILFEVFTDQISGKKMYDIPFAYDDYWKEKIKDMKNSHITICNELTDEVGEQELNICLDPGKEETAASDVICFYEHLKKGYRIAMHRINGGRESKYMLFLVRGEQAWNRTVSLEAKAVSVFEMTMHAIIMHLDEIDVVRTFEAP